MVASYPGPVLFIEVILISQNFFVVEIFKVKRVQKFQEYFLIDIFFEFSILSLRKQIAAFAASSRLGSN